MFAHADCSPFRSLIATLTSLFWYPYDILLECKWPKRPKKWRVVARWININKPIISGFLETRIKETIFLELLLQTLPGWSFDVNYSPLALNGGMVVVWDPALPVITFLRTEQCMVCGVYIPSSRQSFTVALVYARNRESEGRPLWDLLNQLAANSLIHQSP